VLCTFYGTDAKPKCKCLINMRLRKRFGGDGRNIKSYHGKYEQSSVEEPPLCVYLDMENPNQKEILLKSGGYAHLLAAWGIFIKAGAGFNAEVSGGYHIHQQGTRGIFGLSQSLLKYA